MVNKWGLCCFLFCFFVGFFGLFSFAVGLGVFCFLLVVCYSCFGFGVVFLGGVCGFFKDLIDFTCRLDNYYSSLNCMQVLKY